MPPTLQFTETRLSVAEVARLIIASGQATLRDITAGENPFEYSANEAVLVHGANGMTIEGLQRFGPGYILIKGLVAQQAIFFPLINELAWKVFDAGIEIDAICGNVSGGMVPAFALMLYLQHIWQRDLIYFYARATRKQHGSKEMLVGVENNPEIRSGMKVADFEELVKNGETTCNAALTIRESGFSCTHAITILDYDNVTANAKRAEIQLTQISLITLPQLLAVAREEELWSADAIDDYLSYLKSPDKWAARNQLAIIRTLQAKEAQNG